MTLLFKIHYFLYYGAHTAIFGYESVYAQQYTNATTVQFGTLKMILPFIAVIVTPIVCSRADRSRSHRLYFTMALLLATINIFAFFFLPLTMQEAEVKVANATGEAQNLPTQHYSWFGATLYRRHNESSTAAVADTGNTTAGGEILWLGPWVFFCMNTLLFELALAVATCLSDSFAVLQAEESGTSFGHIILWGAFGWAASALLLGLINRIESMPRLLPGILMSALLFVADLLLVTLWPNAKDFKLDVLPAEVARSLTSSSPPGHREPSDYQPSNEANLINLGPETVAGAGLEHKLRKRVTKSPLELMGGYESDPVLPLPSTPAMESGANSASEGQDPYTSKSDVNQSTSHLAKAIDLSNRMRQASPLGAKWTGRQERPTARLSEPTAAATFGLQVKLFLLILDRRRKLIRYLVLFVLSGFFMSMQWNYFFLFLEHAFAAQFTTISALSMVGQSLLGELPIFLLSRWIIDKCGRSHILSLSLISVGLRFLIYRFMLVQVSVWCVFLADALQGPNYGLFYVVMTEVGLEYSFCDHQTIGKLARAGVIAADNERQVAAVRLALRSTVQSVAFACYEGLGVGIGSLVGGHLLAGHDFNLLWLSMALAAIATGLANIGVEVFCPEREPED